jgi:hypothetical protein
VSAFKYNFNDLISVGIMLHLYDMLNTYWSVVHGARERAISFRGVGGHREKARHLGGEVKRS